MKSWTYVEGPRSGGGRAWEGIFARDDGGDLLGSEIDLRNFFEHLMTFSGLKKVSKKK